MLPFFQRLIWTTVVCIVACPPYPSVVRAADAKEAKTAKDGGPQFDVPDGTPEELLSFITEQQGFIKKQQTSQAKGATRKDRIDYIRSACQAVVTAADRVAQAKADDKATIKALKAKFEALTLLKRLGDKDAANKLDAFAEELKNDKRPAIANLLKIQALSKKIEALNANDSEAIEKFVSDVRELISSSPVDIQMVPLAQAALMHVYRSGKHEQAAEIGQEFAKRFASSDNADVLAASIQVIAPTGQILGAEGRAEEGASLCRQYAEQFAKRKEPQVQLAAAQLAQFAGNALESQGKDQEAAKVYRGFATRLSGSDDPAVRGAVSQLEGLARKLELVGQPMPIAGKLVDGGRFDIAQYKGKVVLVDFWATWCGPCVAELPNVKDVYAKYHDRGFEVVGISLDNDADALTKFVKDEQIAWPIVFEEGHPLAKQYGVTAIPTAVLINREGKVVTLSARGEKLGELVDELVGADGPPEKKAE